MVVKVPQVVGKRLESTLELIEEFGKVMKGLIGNKQSWIFQCLLDQPCLGIMEKGEI